MLAANQENAGISPGKEAIRRALAELEAECDRRRNELQNALHILETAETAGSAVYRHLPMAAAVAFYLEAHGGSAKLTEMVTDLETLGVVLTSSAGRSALHNVKIMLSQVRYKKQFSYNPKTDVVTLKLSRD